MTKPKPIKILVITLEGDIKYQIGGNQKSVAAILDEISNCKDEFYKIIDDCAVKKDKILSVEIVEVQPKQQEVQNNG